MSGVMQPIDLNAMAAQLEEHGWIVARRKENHLVATSRHGGLTYDVFGDDDIAEGCAYLNGIMIDWQAIKVIREHLGDWVTANENRPNDD